MTQEHREPPDQRDPRRLLHTRRVIYTAWRRADGLWDIEGELLDFKDYPWQSPERGELPPGSPVHHMKVRVAIDVELRVHEAEAQMPGIPFTECVAAVAPLHGVVGASLGPGWIKVVEATMGGVLGCTHLRELLYGIGTAAYQALSDHAKTHSTGRPRHIGQCVSWDPRGAVIRRVMPQFAVGPKSTELEK